MANITVHYDVGRSIVVPETITAQELRRLVRANKAQQGGDDNHSRLAELQEQHCRHTDSK